MAGGNHFQMRSKISVRTKPFLQGVQCLESWLTTQSAENQSPHQISLLTGEINREFYRIRPLIAIFVSDQRADSIAYRRIPYATEQGISKDISGKIFRGTGICSHGATDCGCRERGSAAHSSF